MSHPQEADLGALVRVLVDENIEIKASTGRARDKMIVPILTALRDEQT